MKKFSIIITLILTIGLFGKFIDLNTAGIVADRWLEFQDRSSENDFSRIDHFTFSKSDVPCFYVFRYAPVGFAIVSADDNIVPILGYSSDSPVREEVENPAVSSYLNKYSDEIFDVIDNDRIYKENQKSWRKLLENDFSGFSNERDVSPLITANWNQDNPWNGQCPIDSQGPGGRVYAGCVAVAMAQIFQYWEYPQTATGSHGYTHPDYGYLEADFGSYNFNLMSNYSATTAVKELLFHCGVAVNMDYGPYGSGAGSNDALYALRNHFDYNNDTVELLFKNSYSQTTWYQILRDELEAGRPMFYAGDGGGYGHAFNLDGYQGTSYFHFNWGWSGWYNGYYYLSNINPGGNNFSNNQQAIIGIQPPEIPDPPTNLEAQVMGRDVLLMWAAPVSNRELLGYNIYRNDLFLDYADGDYNISYYDTDLEEGIYLYYVTAVYDQSESEPSNVEEVTIGTLIEDETVSDKARIICSPNPFSSQTTISFYQKIEDNENPEITIFNTKGQKIRELRIMNYELGMNEITWNGKGQNGKPVSSGIYWYKIKSGNSESPLQKMMLIRE